MIARRNPKIRGQLLCSFPRWNSKEPGHKCDNVSLCASMQVSLCVKLLTGRPVRTGTLYFFDLLNQEFEVIPMT